MLQWIDLFTKYLRHYNFKCNYFQYNMHLQGKDRNASFLIQQETSKVINKIESLVLSTEKHLK